MGLFRWLSRGLIERLTIIRGRCGSLDVRNARAVPGKQDYPSQGHDLGHAIKPTDSPAQQIHLPAPLSFNFNDTPVTGTNFFFLSFSARRHDMHIDITL